MPYRSSGVDLVYDNDYTPVGASSPDLTWTADANLAATTTFGVTGIPVSGTMNWDKALEWIDAMNTANYPGANDWRLWSALNSDGSSPCGPGFDCINSELGHLFYTEGGLSEDESITDSTALSGVFTNMQEGAYWSGTEVSTGFTWSFRADNGLQGEAVKAGTIYGWAVRPGQIAAAPLPDTALLMALGCGVMAASRRTRRRLW